MADYSSLNSGPITGSAIAAELPATDANGNVTTVAKLGHGPQVYNLMHALGYGNRVSVAEAIEVIKAWTAGTRASKSNRDLEAIAEFKAAVAALKADQA